MRGNCGEQGRNFDTKLGMLSHLDDVVSVLSGARSTRLIAVRISNTGGTLLLPSEMMAPRRLGQGCVHAFLR